jgi:hypothetical protein
LLSVKSMTSELSQDVYSQARPILSVDRYK